MLHFETIEPETLDLLKKLMSTNLFAEARLVGGTALALQLGHRKSVDLDLFGHIEALPDEIDDAESDPMPYMFENISWEDVKQSIRSVMRKFGNS